MKHLAPQQRFGLLAYGGAFLLNPLWDIYAILIVIRAWRRPGTRLRAAESLRRIARFGGAALLAGLALGVLVWLGRAATPDPAALLLSLWLLLAAIVAGGALTGLFAGVFLVLRRLAARGVPGEVAAGLLALLIRSVASLPATGVALLAVLALGVRLGLLPIAGTGDSLPDRITHLVIPALSVALLPAWIAARRAVDSLPADPAEHAALVGSEAARAFFMQGGWLIAGLMVVEPVCAYPGAGALLVRSLAGRDVAVVAGLLPVAAAAITLIRLRALVIGAAQQAIHTKEMPEPVPAGHAPSGAPDRRRRLWIAAALVAVPLGLGAWGSLSPPHDPAYADPSRLVEKASAEHRLGTDHAGRDVLSRLLAGQAHSLVVIVTAGLLGAALGWLWGQGIHAWQPLAILAEAAILAAPAPLAAVLPALWLPTGSMSIVIIGLLIGLALTPRLALASAHPGERPPADRIALRFGLAVFAACQISLLNDPIGLGIPEPLPSAGNALARFAEWIAVSPITNDSRFYWRAIEAVAGTWILTAAFGAFQAALAAGAQESAGLEEALG